MKMSHNIGELKISYRTTALPTHKITSSINCADLLREIWDKDLIEYVEQLCIVCLSRSNNVIAYQFLATGGISGCFVDIKVIFQTALLANASSIILAHNHPSGNLKPSDQDHRLTKRICDLGKSLDMPLLDHVIMTRDNYHSMADNGELGY